MSKEAIELLKQVAYELDAYITGGYFPNTHVLLDKVENFLARHEHIEQEPVAWLLSSKDSSYTELRKTEPEGADIYLYQINPLYAAPPKREPLSLTPREQNELHSVLRQKGNLTQDGCWDAIEVFSQFLKEQHSNE